MSQFSAIEVQKLQAQLKEIDEQRKDGKFLKADGSVAEGSDEVSDLLWRCLRWAEIVLERFASFGHPVFKGAKANCIKRGEIPESFMPMFNVLIGMRNDLEKLSITQAWSLRETDLYDFQRQLDKIDESRVDGNWLDENGKPAELYVQRVSYPPPVFHWFRYLSLDRHCFT